MISRFVSFKNTSWILSLSLITPGMVFGSASTEVLSETTWESSAKNYKVIVTNNPDIEELPERTILFYDQISGKLVKKISTPLGFVTIKALKMPSDCFVTIWSGGSAEHVEVFRSSKQSIDLIYEVGTKAGISLVPKDWCPDIIIPGNQYFYDEDKPDTYVKLSEIYNSLPALTNEEIFFGIMEDFKTNS